MLNIKWLPPVESSTLIDWIEDNLEWELVELSVLVAEEKAVGDRSQIVFCVEHQQEFHTLGIARFMMIALTDKKQYCGGLGQVRYNSMPW